MPFIIMILAFGLCDFVVLLYTNANSTNIQYNHARMNEFIL